MKMKYKMSSTTPNTVLKRIFVPLNRYGRQKIMAKFFRTRFVKRPLTRLRNAF